MRIFYFCFDSQSRTLHCAMRPFIFSWCGFKEFRVALFILAEKNVHYMSCRLFYLETRDSPVNKFDFKFLLSTLTFFTVWD